MIDLLAVTGKPILHSRSPLMFNAAFSATGRSAFYTRLLSRSGQEAVEMFRALGLKGMNVTAPYKTDVVPFLDELTVEAQDLGCVNTIFRKGDKLVGTNTDFVGVSRSIEAAGHNISGKTFILLGAGGASAGAAYGLKRLGAKVVIVNRTYCKALELAQRFDVQAAPIEDLALLLSTADGILSTVLPTADLVKKEWLRKDLIVFDANYQSSRLNAMAEELGCPIVYGQDWLLHQAVASYRYFLGEEAPEAAMRQGLKDPHLRHQPRGKALVFTTGEEKQLEEINFDNSYLSLFFASSNQLAEQQFDLLVPICDNTIEETKKLIHAETDKAFRH